VPSLFPRCHYNLWLSMPDVIRPGIHIEEMPVPRRAITAVPTSIAAFVGSASRGPSNKPTTVTGVTEFERIFGKLSASYELGHVIRLFFGNGGERAVIVRVKGKGRDKPHLEDFVGSRTKKTGIYALEKQGVFNLLCLPPVQPGADTSWDLYQAALTYCRERKAMLLIDPPASWAAQPGNAGTGVLTAFNQSPVPSMNGRENGVLYFPRVVVVDPLQQASPRTVVACGAVAGLFAKLDKQRGVWKSPAGNSAMLSGITGLQVQVNDRDNEVLNPAGINCLRQFNGRHVVWGARTLSPDNEWKYIPVRRLALFIETSIAEGISWAAFEPNEEPLWAKLRAATGEFLHGLFRQGAFPGSTPREAYYVNCGTDTTTQADLDAGHINIEVGFAPLRPAEFIVIRIRTRTAERD
jgi:phage tail sheath protein FI